MQSNAVTVAEYLAELPPDRRLALSAVRKAVLESLDRGYEEGMQYGMIGYYVPHSMYPAGYHCDPRQPLPFAGLASRKNHMAIYLMSVYIDEASAAWFRQAWSKTGKKLDMGKSCIRFKKLEDLPLDVIAEVIRRATAKKYIAAYQAALKSTASRSTASKSTASKSAAVQAGPMARKARSGKLPAKKSSAKKASAKKSSAQAGPRS